MLYKRGGLLVLAFVIAAAATSCGDPGAGGEAAEAASPMLDESLEAERPVRTASGWQATVTGAFEAQLTGDVRDMEGDQTRLFSEESEVIITLGLGIEDAYEGNWEGETFSAVPPGETYIRFEHTPSGGPTEAYEVLEGAVTLNEVAEDRLVGTFTFRAGQVDESGALIREDGGFRLIEVSGRFVSVD